MKKFLAIFLIAIFSVSCLDAAPVKRYVRKKVTNVRIPPKPKPAAIPSFYHGVFLGVGVGYSMSKIDYSFAVRQVATSKIIRQSQSIKGNGFDGGLMGGYKWMWKFIGTRVYANLDFQQIGFKGEENYQVDALNYGINADFLATFVMDRSWDFGGFIGIGLGGDRFNIDKKMINNLRAIIVANGKNFGNSSDDQQKVISFFNNAIGKIKKDYFNAWLNVGLSVGIMRHHNIELFFKVPFMKYKIASGSFGDMQGYNYITGFNVDITAKTPVIIKLNYTYTF